MLIGLQEVLAPQLEYIKSELAGMYTVEGVGREDGKDAGEHTAILILKQPGVSMLKHGTFWLGNSPTVAGSRGWDAANPRTVTWAVVELAPNSSSSSSGGGGGGSPKNSSDTTGNHDAAAAASVRRRVLFINTHLDHLGSQSRERSSKQLKDWASRFDCTTLGTC